jgi:deazaflavin-dependent oxidoreductase (nitroreductase family)
MSEMDDYNAQQIEHFRANDGTLSGDLAAMPSLLLHHQGRRSGAERISPLAYQQLDHGWAVFGSFLGSDHHPDWYLNLIANPETTIEIGTDTVPVLARDVSGAERDAIYAQQKANAPVFAEYEERAAPRVIPVIALEPR